MSTLSYHNSINAFLHYAINEFLNFSKGYDKKSQFFKLTIFHLYYHLKDQQRIKKCTITLVTRNCHFNGTLASVTYFLKPFDNITLASEVLR